MTIYSMIYYKCNINFNEYSLIFLNTCIMFLCVRLDYFTFSTEIDNGVIIFILGHILKFVTFYNDSYWEICPRLYHRMPLLYFMLRFWENEDFEIVEVLSISRNGSIVFYQPQVFFFLISFWAFINSQMSSSSYRGLPSDSTCSHLATVARCPFMLETYA